MSQLSSIAIRNVSRNKRRSAITLAAIFVGVTLVVVLKGFTNGFVEMTIRNVVQGKTGALQIHRAGYLQSVEGAPLKLSMPYTPEMMAKIRSVPGITGVTGRIQFNGLISNGLSQTMFIGRGLDLAHERDACPRAGSDVVAGGRELRDGDKNQVLVGEDLAKSFNAVTPDEKSAALPSALGVPATDMVTLNSVSPGGRANSLNATLAGKTNSGLPFENKRVITVPLPFAQELLNMSGQVTEYAVSIDNLDHLDRVVGDLQSTLGKQYEVTPWSDLQPFIRDIINRQKVTLAMISAVLFIIVITGIINTMLMSVFERVREIGTMLAFGVRQAQIQMMFLFEAGALGILGGLGGAAIGRIIVFWLHERGIRMPVSGSTAEDLIRPALPWSFVGLAIGAAIFAALLSAAYPSWKASKMNPVDALRSL